MWRAKVPGISGVGFGTSPGALKLMMVQVGRWSIFRLVVRLGHEKLPIWGGQKHYKCMVNLKDFPEQNRQCIVWVGNTLQFVPILVGQDVNHLHEGIPLGPKSNSRTGTVPKYEYGVWVSKEETPPQKKPLKIGVFGEKTMDFSLP